MNKNLPIVLGVFASRRLAEDAAKAFSTECKPAQLAHVFGIKPRGDHFVLTYKGGY